MLSAMSPLSILVFPACLIAALVSDIRKYQIPNELSVAMVIGFLMSAVIAQIGWYAALIHVGVGIGVLAACIALWEFKIIGAGDAKLLSAVALWIGPDFAPALLMITMAGGVLALAMMALWALGRSVPQALGVAPWLAKLAQKPLSGLPLPYGAAITVGGIAALPQSAIWTALIG